MLISALARGFVPLGGDEIDSKRRHRERGERASAWRVAHNLVHAELYGVFLDRAGQDRRHRAHGRGHNILRLCGGRPGEGRHDRRAGKHRESRDTGWVCWIFTQLQSQVADAQAWLRTGALPDAKDAVVIGG